MSLLLTLSGANSSADSIYLNNPSLYAASKAIDGDGGTFWAANTSNPIPNWWKYDFGSGLGEIVTRIDITPAGSPTYHYGVKDFKIQGSNDDSNWTDLYTGQHADNASLESYTFSNTTVYRYYRVYLTSTWRTGFSTALITQLDLYIDARRQDIIDTVTLSDNFILQITPDSQTISDSISLSDNWEFHTIPEQENISETVSLSDIWNLQINPDNQSILDTITLSDLWSLQLSQPAFYATKIISVNPLIFITNTTPVKIYKVDTTDPENPTWESFSFPSGTIPTDISYLAENDTLYCACADGIILKLNYTDFSTSSSINLSDTSDLLKISSNENGVIATSTDDNNGEIYIVDERTSSILNTTISLLTGYAAPINTDLNLIQAKLLDTSLSLLSTISSVISTNLILLTSNYNTINPKSREDFTVYIDNVLLVASDISLESINITHTIGEKSTAEFMLARKHDDINTNNLGNTVTITNQNNIKIYFDGHLEFEGKISELNCQYTNTNDTVIVKCEGTEKTQSNHLVTMSLPDINSQLGLYDVLIQNPNIVNPYLDTRYIIRGENDKYWTGSSWSVFISNAQIFNTVVEAQDYIDARINSTSTSKIIKDFNAGNPYPDSYDSKNRYYKGIIVDLGIKSEQQIFRQTNLVDVKSQVEAGTFQPNQNYTYYWTASAILIVPEANNGDEWHTSTILHTPGEYPLITTTSTNARYVGTSPISLTNKLWSLTALFYRTQREKEDKETNLGVYTIGEAPFKKVSTRNGWKITKDRWEDKADGLYRTKDESYDFRSFAKQIAAIEYEKLKNINGTIFPIVSSSMTSSIDAYYFYNILMLSRINIDNTTKDNFYKNQNGFPLAVKGITISAQSMTVSYTLDNQLADSELLVLDSTIPDEKDFIQEAESHLNYQKFDFDAQKWVI